MCIDCVEQRRQWKAKQTKHIIEGIRFEEMRKETTRLVVINMDKKSNKKVLNVEKANNEYGNWTFFKSLVKKMVKT